MLATQIPITSWLPMSMDEASKRGWSSFDIILITGDAYVDHPSFGAAVIGRILEAEGYRVGIISQPNWRDDLRDFRKLGKPELFFGVTAGNMDSMVNHYTALKRIRSDDAYTAGGAAGFRPDYASVAYSKILKNIFPDTPVVLGGIEASLRRAVHYDYWSDSLKPSILVDSGADLLLYGMAEKTIIDVAARYQNGEIDSARYGINQIAYIASGEEMERLKGKPVVELPSYEKCLASKAEFAEAFKLIEIESNKERSDIILQRTGDDFLVINPPHTPAATEEIDGYYSLPYTRTAHPRYRKRGAIPAYTMIKHSVTIHRGCFGGCSFCTISMHQGKQISSRSEESVVREVKEITEMDDFKGAITDLGGPSANMYRMHGIDAARCRKCSRPSCIWPSVCSNLNFNHEPLIRLYRKVRSIDKIRQVFIGSGVRYDMLTGQPAHIAEKFRLKQYTTELIRHHVSGRLKVAPEHSDPKVLKLIRKPSFDTYLAFRKEFQSLNEKAGLRQQLIPYLISSLPGCDIRAMGVLAADISQTGYRPEQVQDFTPTPMTLSSVMYYTGIHPYTKEKLYIPATEQAKRSQHLFLFYYKPENKNLIIQKLRESGQQHLIAKIFRDKEKGKKGR